MRLALQMSTAFGTLLLISATAFVPSPAKASDVSARAVTEALFHASSTAPISYAGRDLSFLDLAGLDFKKANLAGTNLYGADLSKSNLSETDLAGARLDNADVSQADFSGANLKGATLLTVSAHQSTNPADAPKFSGADLSDSHIAARLDGADFSNADLTGARIGQLIATWGSYRPRAVFLSANFSEARLRRADLSKGVFQFTRFDGADLGGANLRDCDFTKASFARADLAGADVTNADFDGADLTAVKGLDQAIGLSAAKNLDKAFR